MRFQAQPAALANLLHNVLTISKAKDGPQPLTYLRYTWDEAAAAGQLMGIGAGRFAAGLDWWGVQGNDEGYAEVRLLGANPVKTDIVDDLTKLAVRIRGTTTSKNAAVDVEIVHKRSMLVTYGPELLGELADQDEYDTTVGMNGGPGIFEKVEDLIDLIEGCPAPAGPATFSVDILARLKDLKITGMPSGWGVVDLAAHPTLPVYAAAVGPRFRGLVAALDRDGYSAGGPWGDGPGDPSHLVGGRLPHQRLEAFAGLGAG